MTSQVTILVPFYNRKRFLSDTLKSVFDQTYSNWKIILIDDGSTDKTIDSVQNYLCNPRVQIIRNNHNIGKPKSLNKALKVVDTPYVIELDSDDWFYPHTLEVLIDESTKITNDIAVISGNITLAIEDSSGNTVKEKLVKGRFFKDKYDFLLSNLIVWPRFYLTSALRKIGGWPTDDPFGGKDLDDLRVLLRLIEHYRFHWIDQNLYKYRVHSTNMSTIDREVIANLKEWAVRDALKRWGDQYDPVFTTDEEGWKYVTKLTPVNQSLDEE